MSHLTDHELVDALDGPPPAWTTAHLQGCAACRDRLADLGGILAAARDAEVPEPSPLFWDHLSARIRAETTANDSPPLERRWFSWPVIAPFGGLAVIVAMLLAGVARGIPETPSSHTTAASGVHAGDDVAIEAAWAFTDNLIGTPEMVAALDSELIVPPGSAEVVVADMTAAEQAELVRLLQLEIKPGG